MQQNTEDPDHQQAMSQTNVNEPSSQPGADTPPESRPDET